jgi:hypothetical protein
MVECYRTCHGTVGGASAFAHRKGQPTGPVIPYSWPPPAPEGGMPGWKPMEKSTPQSASEPPSAVLDYQARSSARSRVTRRSPTTSAMLGGICVFFLYILIVFAGVACCLIFDMDGSENLMLFLLLPSSLVTTLSGPLGEVAFFVGILMNATFWAAIWASLSLGRQSRVDGRPLLGARPQSTRVTRRRQARS